MSQGPSSIHGTTRMLPQEAINFSKSKQNYSFGK